MFIAMHTSSCLHMLPTKNVAASSSLEIVAHKHSTEGLIGRVAMWTTLSSATKQIQGTTSQRQCNRLRPLLSTLLSQPLQNSLLQAQSHLTLPWLQLSLSICIAHKYVPTYIPTTTTTTRVIHIQVHMYTWLEPAGALSYITMHCDVAKVWQECGTIIESAVEESTIT